MSLLCKANLLDSNTNYEHVVVRFISLLVRFNITYVLDDINSFDNSSEHGVFIIEPRSWNDGNKELRSVCIRSGVGHTHRVRPVVFERRMELVFKLVAPYRLASGSVTCAIEYSL